MAKANKPIVTVSVEFTPLNGHPFCALIRVSNSFVPSPRPIEFHQHLAAEMNQNIRLANNLQRMLAEELLWLKDDKSQEEIIRQAKFSPEGIHITMTGPYDRLQVEQKIQKVMEKCFAGEEVSFTAENAIPV